MHHTIKGRCSDSMNAAKLECYSCVVHFKKICTSRVRNMMCKISGLQTEGLQVRSAHVHKKSFIELRPRKKEKQENKPTMPQIINYSIFSLHQ